jgi:hypothetical protein
MNKLIKQVMGTLLRGHEENPAHWTAYVAAALVLLNKQPKAAKGMWSAPQLIAGGVVDQRDLLLADDVDSPAALSLPILNDHAAFVQQIRIKVSLFFLFSLHHLFLIPPLSTTTILLLLPPQSIHTCDQCFYLSYSHPLHPIPSILVIGVSIYLHFWHAKYERERLKREAAQRAKRKSFFEARGYEPGALVRYYPKAGKPTKKKAKLAGALPFYSGIFMRLVGETEARIKWLDQGPTKDDAPGSESDIRIERIFVAPPLPGSAAAIAADSLEYAALTGISGGDLSSDNESDEQNSDDLAIYMDLDEHISDDFDLIVEI